MRIKLLLRTDLNVHSAGGWREDGGSGGGGGGWEGGREGGAGRRVGYELCGGEHPLFLL